MRAVYHRLTRSTWRIWIVLAALAICLIGIGLKPVIRNDIALDRIETLGGDFYSHHYQAVDHLPWPWRKKLNSVISPIMSLFLGEKWAGRFKRINGVDLRRTSATDDDLRILRNQYDINWLWLADLPITDEGLVHLSKLSPDNYIHLEGTNITGEGLVHLSGMTRLKTLDLSDTAVDDEGLRHLRSMSGLRSLSLTRTKVTTEGMEELQTHLPKCRIRKWGHLN